MSRDEVFFVQLIFFSTFHERTFETILKFDTVWDDVFIAWYRRFAYIKKT